MPFLRRSPQLLLGLVAGVVVLVLLGGVLLATGQLRPPGQSSSSSAASAGTPSSSADLGSPVAAASVPVFSHVFVIVMENKGYDTIVGSDQMPYLHALMTRSGVADAYQAVAKPSQPNYLALFSGSTHGVTDDDAHDLDAPSLADQLEDAGRTWRVVAENYPGDCFEGKKASNGRDGPGTYVRKHDPAISFRSIAGSPRRCANITDLTAFDPAAADFQLIVPNLCHDLHDCPLDEGDRWLSEFVPRIMESAAFRDDGVLVITFDEPEGGGTGDGSSVDRRVLTVVASPLVRPGERSSVSHTHYSLLRTIQEAWSLPCLAESCQANDLGEFFAAG